MSRVNPANVPSRFVPPDEDEPLYMQPEVGMVEDNGEPEPEGGQDPTQAQIQLLQSQVQEQSLANQLLSDPNIRAYVDAKMRGQNPTLGGQPQGQGQQQQQSPEDEEPVDLETMNNTELFSHMLKKVTGTISGLIDNKLQPLQQMTQGLQQSQQEQVANQVQSTLVELRKQYPDFDKFSKQMVLLNNQVGGTLPPKDLYFLAKAQAGFEDVKRQAFVRTQTERPVSTSAVPGRTRPKQQQTAGGGPANSRMSFKNALDSALNQLQF